MSTPYSVQLRSFLVVFYVVCVCSVSYRKLLYTIGVISKSPCVAECIYTNGIPPCGPRPPPKKNKPGTNAAQTVNIDAFLCSVSVSLCFSRCNLLFLLDKQTDRQSVSQKKSLLYGQSFTRWSKTEQGCTSYTQNVIL